MLTNEPEVVGAASDRTLPEPARFFVARFAEALDIESPLHRRAVAHCDPRAVVRDLTVAIATYDQLGGGRFAWALLAARIQRIRELLQFDRELDYRWRTETAAMRSALTAVPTQPGEPDWASARSVVQTAAVALRSALADDLTGYRRRLTEAVSRAAAAQQLPTEPSLRRDEERMGLLASMLLDEGQEARGVMTRLVEAVRASQDQRQQKVFEALWSSPKPFEILVGVVGVQPWPGLNHGVSVYALRSLYRDLRRRWPRANLCAFLAVSRMRGGSHAIAVELHARDAQHAVRLARGIARETCAHQATGALHRRPRTIDVSLVRRRHPNGSAAVMLPPPWHIRLTAPVPHPPTLAAPSMRYAARAADSESDVARVLDGWIALESLLLGRGGSAANLACREIPDLAWLLACRELLLGPWNLLAMSSLPAAQRVVAHVFSGTELERAWLDVLAGAAPPAVAKDLATYSTALDPLSSWRLVEAQTLLKHGPVLVERINRYSTQVEWMMRRLREQRNAIAHGAAGDQPFMPSNSTYDTSSSAPTDARLLGGFAVAVLDTFGAIAIRRLLDTASPASSAPLRSPQALLQSASSKTLSARNHAGTVNANDRVFVRPPREL